MLLELNLSNKFCNELKWTVQFFGGFLFWLIAALSVYGKTKLKLESELC